MTRSWTTGTPWVPRAVAALDGLSATALVVAIGIVCAVIGVLLIWAVLRPATRTHHRATVESADVWISASAVATLAREAADRTPGVLSADARARKRRVDVTVTADGSAADVKGRVEQTIGTQLHGLDERTVKVKDLPMSRTLNAFDRIATLVLAVLLIAAGSSPWTGRTGGS